MRARPLGYWVRRSVQHNSYEAVVRDLDALQLPLLIPVQLVAVREISTVAPSPAADDNEARGQSSGFPKFPNLHEDC